MLYWKNYYLSTSYLESMQQLVQKFDKFPLFSQSKTICFKSLTFKRKIFNTTRLNKTNIASQGVGNQRFRDDI